MVKTALRKFNQEPVKILSYNEKYDIYLCEVIRTRGKYSEMLHIYLKGSDLILSELTETLYD